MKQFAGFLFSTPLMAVVLTVFAISIGAATFIENDFGTASARYLVYNARWFEILLLVGGVNLLGRIFTKKLYKPATFTIFLFHISFIVILCGAAITRYTGWEGSVSIREGESTSFVLTDKPFIRVSSASDHKIIRNYSASFDPVARNKFRKEFEINGKNVRLSVTSFIPNAVETIIPDNKGNAVAEFIYADSSGRKNGIVSFDAPGNMGNLTFTFDTIQRDTSIIRLLPAGDSLSFTAPWPVTVSSMDGNSFKILHEGVFHRFIPQLLYTFNGQMVVMNRYYNKGSVTARQVSKEQGETYDAVEVRISSGSESKKFILMGKAGYPAQQKIVVVNGVKMILSYGSVYNALPFNLKLNDFILERYPGSQSPSSFESRVTLTDAGRHIQMEKRIYMNNILKYRGYRFFQSSYDTDEKGTILSVNHDLAGTLVSYTGYFLMTLGMICSLFNRKSRFSTLGRLQKSSKTGVVLIFILLLPSSLISASVSSKNVIQPVNQTHAGLFGRLLVQDNSGRIEPVSTLTSEVLRKLVRKDTYKGMNADQVFLGMFSDPSKWQHEPIIRTNNERIQRMLRVNDKYVPFSAFFKDNQYILENYAESAYRKKPAARTRFDNEIMKVDERVNIAYLVFSGEFLKMFPVPGDSSLKWYSQQQIRGLVHSADSVFTENILYLYVQEVQKSMESGDWSAPDEILNSISAFQKRFTPSIIPAERKVSTELFLNKYDILSDISKYYGIAGFILLLFQFISIFNSRLKTRIPLWICGIAIFLVFLAHTAGLGLRWYVSGHAPWSNGYEALTYVAWATVMAGLIFVSRSPVSLSVTSILSFLILTVAHLSWMDPQITNLVPVLKSYWLVIHVATITASYGFLAMGAILAFVNILVLMFLTRKNKGTVSQTIPDISHTIEMALTVGLYLLTIGVFLGAVWANESWGRYWGWDPKETWALVTVLVYAFVLHMRMVPGMGGLFSFNLASLLAFGSVIMTYFGVNYYLSGLHSYAKGDPLPVPAFVYYTLAIVIFTAAMAYYKYRKIMIPIDNTAA